MQKTVAANRSFNRCVRKGAKMQILEYLFGVLLFCGVFFVGQLMAQCGLNWQNQLKHRETVRNFFLYTGRILQVVGFAWAFVDGVGVLVLGSALIF